MSILKICLLVLAVLSGLFLRDQLGLWAERRGWLL